MALRPVLSLLCKAIACLAAAAGAGIAVPVLAAAPTVGDFYANSYAVVIGVSRYPSPTWPDLDFARKDAEGMARYLRGQGFEVVELYDEKATRAAIVGAMEDNLAARLQPGDRTLVFFSGHGETKTYGGVDYGYIVPYDGSESAATLISMDQLRALAEKMGAAKHQLFIMDACYGGQFAQKASVAGISPRHPDFIREVARRPARQFITAGGKDQQVLAGGPKGYSYFTGFLLEALDEGLGDLNGDGYVTWSELAAYLVPRATNAYQTPGFGTMPGHGLGEFLFQAPGGAVEAREGPALGSAVALKGGADTASEPKGEGQPAVTPDKPSDTGTAIAALPTGPSWEEVVLPEDRSLIVGARATAGRVNDRLQIDATRRRLVLEKRPSWLRNALGSATLEISADELPGDWQCKAIRVSSSSGVIADGFEPCTIKEGSSGLILEAPDHELTGQLFPKDPSEFVLLGAVEAPGYSALSGSDRDDNAVGLLLKRAEDRLFLLLPGERRYELWEMVRAD